MKNIHSFRVKEKEYEIFVAEEDGFIELYEKNHPKDGLTFKDKKALFSFINVLTDFMEFERI